MSLLATLDALRADTERRLSAYSIRPCERSGFKIVRRCMTGETHVGFFMDRDDAEAYLETKLPVIESEV